MTSVGPDPAFEKLLDLFRTALGEKVQMVRESKRLTDSPCCLINPTGGFSTQLQKVLSLNNKDYEMSKRILEINPASVFFWGKTKHCFGRLCDALFNLHFAGAGDERRV